MRTSSAKAKGRRLQDWVREQLKEKFNLTDDDVRVAIMGETGADIKLTSATKKLLPFKIECKNQEVFGSVYKAYAQASDHTGNEEPLLFIKKNREKVLVILDATYFLELVLKNVKR